MIPDCPECGARMSLIDETTKLVEYRCKDCHTKEIVWKDDRTEADDAAVEDV